MLLCYAMGASSEIEYKKRAAREASKLFVFLKFSFILCLLSLLCHFMEQSE